MEDSSFPNYVQSFQIMYKYYFFSFFITINFYFNNHKWQTSILHDTSITFCFFFLLIFIEIYIFLCITLF